MSKTKKKNEVTPPDLKQCQAEKPNGNSAFTVGGIPGLVRCTNRPLFVVTETQPGPDGLRGSMSLCAECLEVFSKSLPPGYATVERIKEN